MNEAIMDTICVGMEDVGVVVVKQVLLIFDDVPTDIMAWDTPHLEEEDGVFDRIVWPKQLRISGCFSLLDMLYSSEALLGSISLLSSL